MGLEPVRGEAGRAAPETLPRERAPHRDWQAFERIVESHRSRIWSLALRTLGEPKAAEQVLNDTFLTAWNELPQLAADAPIPPWLFGLCAKSLWPRLEKPEATAPLDLVPAPFGAPCDEASRPAAADWTEPGFEVDDGLRKAVTAAVAGLPTEQRVAFVLGDLGELSCADIAAAWNLSASVIRRRVHEARLCIVRAVECHQQTTCSASQA